METGGAALIDRALDAMNRGDLEGLREITDSDFELHDLESLPDSDVYHGLDAFAQWRERVSEQFEEFSFNAEGAEPVGDLLVTDMLVEATGKGSGARVSLGFAAVWGFRGGKISYHHGYETRERALEAARAAE